MTVGRNGLLTFAGFVAAFVLLTEAGRAGDTALRAAIWIGLTVTSVAALVRMIRQRKIAAHGQDATLPKRWRDWVLDEPKDRR